jgi:hypothetical protein
MLEIAISAAFERNYYADELKITNKCLPVHMGLWGEQNTPERGWFETIENCSNQGYLETRWKFRLANSVLGFGLEDNRLASIVYTNGSFETIPDTPTTRYSTREAENIANGMVAVVAGALENRVFLTAKGTCVYLSTPILRNFTRDVINSYHFQYPYMHVIESNDSWCFEKP